MCVLTDCDIRQILCPEEICDDPQNKLQISPFAEESLTPVGYDIRVGSLCASAHEAKLLPLAKGDSICIRPGDTVLITSLENIQMPQNKSISGIISSKVTLVSAGLSHVCTTIDPDWKGNLLIAVHNYSQKEIKLEFGQSLCTIVFLKNKSPAKKPCGKEPGRIDVFRKEFIKHAQESQLEEKRIRKKRQDWIRIGIGLSTMSVFFLLGLKIFGNAPGTIAMTAMAGTLLQLFLYRS